MRTPADVAWNHSTDLYPPEAGLPTVVAEWWASARDKAETLAYPESFAARFRPSPLLTALSAIESRSRVR